MLYVILGIIVIIVVWFIAAYNGFITLINRAKEAWADIDVQLKRRYDLIPNLVNTVKGYAAHESQAFENVTKARAAAMGAGGDLADKAKAEGELSGALSHLFAVAEAYPELKANQNFLSLQNELSDTENKIAYARQFYNSVVLDYNTKLKVFPNVIFAKLLNFQDAEFFGATDEERKTVKVSF